MQESYLGNMDDEQFEESEQSTLADSLIDTNDDLGSKDDIEN